MLEKEIGMCINFRELRDETGSAKKITDYGMLVLPHVSMVRFLRTSAGRGIPRWFMTDVFKRGKSVKWLLASGERVLQRSADKYPMLSEAAMDMYSDFRWAKEKAEVPKRNYTKSAEWFEWFKGRGGK